MKIKDLDLDNNNRPFLQQFLLSATIANFFAKEKDVLKQEIATKADQIDELKLKVYRLENEVSALKQDIKVWFCHVISLKLV